MNQKTNLQKNTETGKSKRETKKFTPFRHFQDLNKFLD